MTTSQESSAQKPTVRQSPGRVLLAYFSHAGENYYYGGRSNLDVGNVRVPAIMSTFAESYEARSCPRAAIGQGLAVKGEEVRDAGPNLQSWLQRIRLLET